jgi:sugar/nucleoside kinase (ribokinase family)
MVKIIGVGDNVVDLYLHKNIMYPGGNAVNVAVYAGILGAEPAYLGIYGTDRAGGHIREVLRQKGIDQSRCRIVEGENGFSAVDLIDGDRTYVGGNDGGVSKTSPLRFDADDLQYLAHYDLIHTSCYSHIVPELPKLRSAGPLISFDFSNRFTKEYGEQVCPYIDFALISCGSMPDDEISEVIETAHSAGCKTVLASMGRRGARLSAGGESYDQPAGKEKAIDTLGAGDAFFTGFIVSYLEADVSGKTGNPEIIRESLRKAAEFATKICMWDGAFGCGININ